MKTAKSIIVVLFVLLTAQIASAFYCPSTGRWLSRDPIGEPGFQVLQTAFLPSGRWLNRSPRDKMALFKHFLGGKSDDATVKLLEETTKPPYLFNQNGAISKIEDIPGISLLPQRRHIAKT